MRNGDGDRLQDQKRRTGETGSPGMPNISKKSQASVDRKSERLGDAKGCCLTRSSHQRQTRRCALFAEDQRRERSGWMFWSRLACFSGLLKTETDLLNSSKRVDEKLAARQENCGLAEKCQMSSGNERLRIMDSSAVSNWPAADRCRPQVWQTA